ncbi:MAG: rod shape-determining protein MreC [Terracidiphilus sp.]|jgi:rod shape-determining protein MreC
MESFIIRYRNLVVLLALLMLQLVGLAVQVHRTTSGTSSLEDTDPGGVRLIRLWANAVISPPERLIHSSTTGMATMWSNYIDLVHVRKQNQNLENTVDRLRLEQAALLEDARQGERLQAMLGFQQQYIYSTLAAQVYGSSGSDRSHVFYIDKGWHDGLKPDMAVITAEGIVGKVRDVFPHTAQVLAVNDTTSGAGVILETTRIRGVLRGDATGQLEVVGVTADERIRPGEHVLTAGGDLIFPRGLAVGAVKKVVRDPDRDGLVDIILTPAAPLDRLDEVLVITSTEPRFSPQQEQDLSKSAAEQSAVPAGIKDQMKASEIMAEKLPGLIDPNLPPDQQPLNDTSNPTIAPRPPQPLHPDQYSASTNDDSGATPEANSTPKQKPQSTTPRNP